MGEDNKKSEHQFEVDTQNIGKYYGIFGVDGDINFLKQITGRDDDYYSEIKQWTSPNNEAMNLINRFMSEDKLGMGVFVALGKTLDLNINPRKSGKFAASDPGGNKLYREIIDHMIRITWVAAETFTHDDTVGVNMSGREGDSQGTIDVATRGGKPTPFALEWTWGQDWIDEVSAGPNMRPSSPTKQSPNTSVIQLAGTKNTPAHINTGAVQLFMNAMPTHEISRCIPYLDVVIVEDVPPLSNAGSADPVVQSINLAKSILGPISLGHGNSQSTGVGHPDYLMTTAVDTGVMERIKSLDRIRAAGGSVKISRNQEGLFNFSTAGMEMFLSPQTMGPLNTQRDHQMGDISMTEDQRAAAAPPQSIERGQALPSGRPQAVLDRFRPLASLESFSVDVAYSVGFISFKTGELSLVIHDRSRLHELASLIRPSDRGRTKLMIEYGWSHSGGVDSATYNYYGKFLNGLRVKELWRVSNSDYDFNEDGSVNVTLKVHTEGTISLGTITIPEGVETAKARESMDELVAAINKARIQVLGKGSVAKSLNKKTFLNSITTTSTALSIKKETRGAIKKFLDASTENADLQDLKKALRSLYGKDGKSGTQKTYRDTVSASIAKKVALMTKTPDPWLIDLYTTKKQEKAFAMPYINSKHSNPKRRSYVTLAKLISIFVIEPLAASGRFEEIQVIFYSFNEKASWMRHHNIAQFPISIEDFTKKFKKFSQTGLAIPVTKFLNFLRTEYVSNPSSWPYGFSNMYDIKADGYKYKKGFQDAATLANENSKRLAAAYGVDYEDPASVDEDLIFKPPRLEFQVQCVPLQHDPKQSATVPSALPKSLLRIHIFDAQQPSDSCLKKIVDSAFDETMGIITKSATVINQKSRKEGTMAAKYSEDFAASLRLGLKAKIIKTSSKIDDRSTDAEILAAKYTLNGNFEQVKRYIAYSMPMIDIGASNSAVISAKLSTQNNPLLATISMQKSKDSSSSAAQGVARGGLPMQINPTTVSLETYGNPLLAMGQQYFINFNTGTSADNVYRVHKISHKISPGEFKTEMDLINLESYGQFSTQIQVIQDALTAIDQIEKPKS